jgi:hypothetical protein
VTDARHRMDVPTDSAARVPRSLRRRALRVALPAAAVTLVTGGVVGVAVGLPGSASSEQTDASASAAASASASASATPAGDSVYLADRVGQFSRSTDRTTLQALPKVEDHQFMNAPLNVWPEPREHGKPLDVLPWASKVAVTGVERHGFAQVLIDREVRWVNADYLQEHKPKPKPKPKPEPSASPSESSAPAGLSDAPCPVSSDIESGLQPGAIRVYRAVCAAFPQVTEYGGWRNDGEHSDGKAVDIMVYDDSATGDAIAQFLQEHAAELDLYDVIWSQHIWTPERASEGWRLMEDRGSTTANHYDHVHVAVN